MNSKRNWGNFLCELISLTQQVQRVTGVRVPPFSNRRIAGDTPLIEAKLELVQERGGDAFTEFSLLEAILKLRQSVGRLIRTKTDRGIVVILDTES